MQTKPSFAQGTLTPVKISANGQEADGNVFIQSFSSKERWMRGLKLLGMLWGMALVSIVIPLAHFVLVPGFLIAGIVTALWISSKESIILGGNGTCPSCQKPLPIVRMNDQWPLNDLCTSCRREVKIEKITVPPVET